MVRPPHRVLPVRRPRGAEAEAGGRPADLDLAGGVEGVGLGGVVIGARPRHEEVALGGLPVVGGEAACGG